MEQICLEIDEEVNPVYYDIFWFLIIVLFFRSRLSINGENIDCLPHNLIRKYIAYAQKYVHPQLSDEAKKVLKEFYLSLRKQFQIGDCTPVTTRQLNSLIRLTQVIKYFIAVNFHKFLFYF